MRSFNFLNPGGSEILQGFLLLAKQQKSRQAIGREGQQP